ncbi:hypothetical Protein YC6258_00942 [Gynuella sunshinyii YC6258]|uniref:Uncharacterized protein n=1 Tax=Gynuella sunshinyii YC6258 TaxID=1445510 RepID=A0A0C5VEK4_9GAMM|nr:hypothetical Protein YC6258_00942 [Gynuella sunshinyii YC6258]
MNDKSRTSVAALLHSAQYIEKLRKIAEKSFSPDTRNWQNLS